MITMITILKLNTEATENVSQTRSAIRDTTLPCWKEEKFIECLPMERKSKQKKNVTTINGWLGIFIF